MVPSYNPLRTYSRKLSTLAGALSRKSFTRISPWLVCSLTCGCSCTLLSPVSALEESSADTGESNVQEQPQVRLQTNQGEILVKLFLDKAPASVDNFLEYVRSGLYDGTIFHRVIPGFMIQGGGFTPEMSQKETNAPIKNEAGNGLKNARGTLAMARTQVVDSATAQFFINLTDNDFLNQRDESVAGYGY